MGLVIKNGNIVTSNSEYTADIYCDGGVIKAIGKDLEVPAGTQVVDGSGGSWWRRAWRTRGTRRDAVCTWCGRPPSEVEKLVAGPNVYICDRCVKRAEQELARTRTAAGATTRRAAPRCSFCSKREDASRRVVAGGAASICSDCLRLCRDFMQIGE